MKKIFLTTLVTSILLVGCSSLDSTKNYTNKRIGWEVAGHLPAQRDFSKNIGVAGGVFGQIDDYILIGGGANFPYKPVAQGGAKETYSDIYLLKEKNGKLNVVEHSNFPHKIAYGASVTTENGIYYIGGGNSPETDKDIWFITLKNGELDYEKIGELPFSFQNGGAVIRDNILYIIAGKQDGKASTDFYSFDLKTKEIKKLANVPGQTRTQFVTQILGDELFVFGGGNSIAFNDGYKYSFETNSWTEVAPITLNNRNISVLGGSSIKLNEKELLVIGGFNKEIWDSANYYLGNLKGEELVEYKNKYFSSDPLEFNWNKEILVYNKDKNSWYSLGEIPFDAPCGEGLVKIKNKIFSINGEIKPGVRTNRVYLGNIF